jgi:hypothetical protein
MHGIWLLMFAPLAALVAWRYSGANLRKLAFYSMVLLGIFLVGWFGYLSATGAEYTNSLYERIMNSVGVIIRSINLPICQILVATAIVAMWPRKFQFASAQSAETPDALETVVETDGI